MNFNSCLRKSSATFFLQLKITKWATWFLDELPISMKKEKRKPKARATPTPIINQLFAISTPFFHE